MRIDDHISNDNDRNLMIMTMYYFGTSVEHLIPDSILNLKQNMRLPDLNTNKKRPISEQMLHSGRQNCMSPVGVPA